MRRTTRRGKGPSAMLARLGRGAGVVGTIALTGLAALALAACGGESSPAPSASTAAPLDTAIAVEASDRYVIDPVPEGWEIERAHEDPETASVYYRRVDDRDRSFFVRTYRLDAAEVRQARDALEDPDSGGRPVRVGDHDAHLGPLRDDGRTYGDDIVWITETDLVVEVGVPFDAGVEVVDVAARAHPVAPETFTAISRGTTGGGTAAPPVPALSGSIDGDPWEIDAVLPEGYPLQPVDNRRGCAELRFRGETATMCDRSAPLSFPPYDDGHQAVIDGVAFVFGVVGDGEGEVHVANVEQGAGPWTEAQVAVLPEAPQLTWFAVTYDEVCDRSAVSVSGLNVGIVVPPGYPHRNDCTD